MAAPAYRVADVIRTCWGRYNRDHRLPPHVARAVGHILRCRTRPLGGHLHRCTHCGSEVPVYNGCLSRHCPSCQSRAARRWLADRHAELLPVQYFHVVFTLPHGLNGLVDANRKLLFGEFFATVGWVLQRFARDPRWRLEGELGYIALLHTWTQRLMEHVHIHCIVPGGVWREGTREWIPARGKWLFRKDSLADAFRNRYIKRLRSCRRRGLLAYTGRAAPLADDTAWEAFLDTLANQRWIVYPKSVPASPATALRYLARYTHKVAISDHRIKAIDSGHVTYTWRDRSDDNTEKTDRIPIDEFTRRFLAHILPDRFHKIRYGGWMSGRKRAHALAAIRETLGCDEPPPLDEETAAPEPTPCPHCGKGTLEITPIRIPRIRRKPT